MITKALTREQKLRIWDNNAAYDRTDVQIRAGQYLKSKSTRRFGRFIAAYLIIIAFVAYMLVTRWG